VDQRATKGSIPAARRIHPQTSDQKEEKKKENKKEENNADKEKTDLNHVIVEHPNRPTNI